MPVAPYLFGAEYERQLGGGFVIPAIRPQREAPRDRESTLSEPSHATYREPKLSTERRYRRAPGWRVRDLHPGQPPDRDLHLAGRRRASLGRRGARRCRAYLTLPNMTSKCSHIGHSYGEPCDLPRLAGIMLVTLISQPHLGQGRRVIACLVWMVGWVSGIDGKFPFKRRCGASLTAPNGRLHSDEATPRQRYQILHHTHERTVQYCSTPSSRMLPSVGRASGSQPLCLMA